MAFCWHADDGPTLNAGFVATVCDCKGIRTSIAKKLYIFVIVSGDLQPSPPLDPRMCLLIELSSVFLNNSLIHISGSTHVFAN